MRSIFVRAGHLLGARVESVTQISGGSLSSVSRLGLIGGGTAIAKTGSLVAVEATMLEALRGRGLPTPTILAMEAELLILEDLPAAGRLARAWANLADILDHLHLPTAGGYGWDSDYAFSNVAIPNGRKSSWVEFWSDNRLRCHLPHVDRHLGDRLEQLVRRLGDFLPDHPPAALLHGDLWGGNILVNDVSISGLIDPAAYYGHREVDLAMLSLFDNPPVAFYEACGLEEGWRERQPIYRLWPLLVHARLFGGSYVRQASACLGEIGF
ncbi:fructosamine kinase family protein [Sphingobium sp. TKS]|uniref:fructosamine kinase family protein n=1 Tax=Sphingobium sp. TKS TaxID=1315974 RepID=UPI000770289C|nr:fructosamine kinase family protein [Sphingobium sp. TKS]AMK25867.1 aminoglycoside phosphotransferase [Sphingobium sp. TKS]